MEEKKIRQQFKNYQITRDKLLAVKGRRQMMGLLR